MMSVFHAATEILMGAQTEIAIFFIAICAHTLIFGKYRIKHAPLKPTGGRIPKQGFPSKVREGTSGHVQRSPKVTSFIWSIKQFMQEGANHEVLVQHLDQHLQSCPPKDALDMLVGLLEHVGKATTVELLTAIRGVMQKYNMRPQGRLVDLMLRSYLTLQMQGDFDKFLAEVDDMGDVTFGTALLYLRAALQSSDLKAALTRIKSCACQWRANLGQTPSNAPQFLMQQLVQLASGQAQLPMLLRELQDCGLFSPAVLECALAECAQNNHAMAMQTVEELARAFSVDFTTTAYCMLVRGASDDRKVLDIYNQHLANIDVCNDTYAAQRVVEAAFQCHRLDIIDQLLMLSKEVPKQVALLKSFAAKGYKDVVNAIFQGCPEKNTCLYNALLSVFVDSEDVQAAEHVMAKAVAAGVADVVTYNTIIKAYLLAKDPKRARMALKAMQAAGLTPNCVTFNELINDTILININDVWALIDEMAACGLKPNQVTCSILLKSIQPKSRIADVERTLAVLDSMDDELDEVLLSSTCEACIRVGRADLLTQQLLRQRTSRRVKVKGAHTFGSLIRAHGYIKDVKGAWEMWREMRQKNIVPTSITIGCMVEALVLNGDVEAGYELIHELLSNEQTRPLVNAIIYCSVLKGFSHQLQFDRVWALYQEMLLEKVQFSIVTYNALIDACARSGEMARVPPLLEEMCNQKITPNIVTYSTVLKGYCNERSIDKALELFEDMKKTAEFQPDEITYNTLLDGCARLGLYDRGVALLSDMQEQGVRPSNFTLSVVAKLATRSKRPDKAFELCGQISRKYQIRYNVHVYNNLVQACTLFGDNQHALQIFEQMLHQKVRPDARTYTLLLRGCVGAKQAEDAAGLLCAALGVRGAHPQVVAFGTNVLRLRESLNPEVITEVLEGISNHCCNQKLAVQLLMDLRTLPNIKLDPKLPLRLTSKAINIAN